MSVTIHVWDQAGYSTRSALADVPALLQAGATLWIAAVERDEGLARFLESVLGLHPLTIEDILTDRPAPKVEDYGTMLYVVAQGALARNGELKLFELDLVWNAQWIFTHHSGAAPSVDAVVSEMQRNPRAIERGPAFVAHALLDRLVDAYLPIVDRWDEEIDGIEAEVVANPSPEILQRIFRLKHELQGQRRNGVHQREVLSRLARGEFSQVSEQALPFYRDVHDHFLRVTDLVDSYRELLSSALDAYLSAVSNRMNEVMKTLTIVSTVLLPMTFIAGVYGMNFAHMPELQWRYGYAVAWGLMLAVGGGLLLWFKTRKWL